MEPTAGHAMDWLQAGSISPDPRDPRGDPRGVVGDDDMNARARAVRETFRTPAGAIALDTILQLTVFRSPVDHRLDGGLYERYAQLRQGQNQIAASILAYIAHAEKLERKDNAPRLVEPRPTDPLPGGRRSADSGGPADPGQPDRPAGPGDDWLAALATDPGAAVTG